MIRRILAAVVIAVALAGCGTTSQPNPTPQVTVFAVKGAYEAALTAAVAYARLPRCTPATGPVCSQQAIVDQVVRAQGVTRDAISAAEGAVRTPGFGQDAVQSAVAAAQAAQQALTAITRTLRTQ